MKKSILTSLVTIPYFTIEGVRQLLGDESYAAGTIRTALYRWMKAGHVIQLKKGVYMTRRFYELHRADADFSAAISAILIPQSYVSLEFILQRNGILTEITYPVSAITFKNTRVIENKLGTFSYRHIKDSLYNGFVISDYLGVPFAQATLAKALFDTLYLRPLSANFRSAAYNLSEELRLNLDDFPDSDRREFVGFVEKSRSKKMDRLLRNLEDTVWQH